MVVLDNQEDIIGTVGLDAFSICNVGICVLPISCILSVKDCFSVDECFVRRNILRVAFLILFEQIIALLNDEVLGQRDSVPSFFCNLITVLLEAEVVLVVRDENGDSLKDPRIVDLIVVEGNGWLLTGLQILIIQGCRFEFIFFVN